MTPGLQPFLSDAVTALRAPTQIWSGTDGDLIAGGIDGIYHGDLRHVRAAVLSYGGAAEGGYSLAEPVAVPEPVAHEIEDASQVRFTGLLRLVDDLTPDPKVRLVRDRAVTAGRVQETVLVSSHLDAPLTLLLRLRVEPEFAPLQEVKSGTARRRPWTTEESDRGVRLHSGAATLAVTAPGSQIVTDDEAVTVSWELTVPPRSTRAVEWAVRMSDPSLVVQAAAGDAPWPHTVAAPAGADARLQPWLDRALGDLDALRLALPDHPEDEFLAAGAPWFFTLFGRDALWTARLLLPLQRATAASTLRVLARLQGETTDPQTAEQPGKILHELRSSELSMPGEGIVLPPRYYGTVDATPLWVCLLNDVADAGASDDEVREFMPNLLASIGWILDAAQATGFLTYVDETGHGLSNQGWKDSGDSIQWRDGRLAEGPIALCEVQGYAYEAVSRTADLLDRLDEPGSNELRAWADALKARFAEQFWVQTPEGAYPAIALDREGAAVDSLTSNIGHLLGTGILDAEQEADIAALLVSPALSSGFGLRTLSTGAAGYWPLSYHGGSVWAHDTAIAAWGLHRSGHRDHARTLVSGLLAAATAFDGRMPELYAGDSAADVRAPAPYPAACRPQAWSAAAAVTALEVLRAGSGADDGSDADRGLLADGSAQPEGADDDASPAETDGEGDAAAQGDAPDDAAGAAEADATETRGDAAEAEVEGETQDAAAAAEPETETETEPQVDDEAPGAAPEAAEAQGDAPEADGPHSDDTDAEAHETDAEDAEAHEPHAGANSDDDTSASAPESADPKSDTDPEDAVTTPHADAESDSERPGTA